VIATAALPLCLSGLVYMGFLPFVLTFPLYALLLGVWLGREGSMLRTALAAALLVALFICHVVGAVIGSLAIFVLSLVDWWRGPRGLPALVRDLAALAPVACGVLWFLLLSDHPSDLHARFHGPVDAVKAFFGYNLSTLSATATAANALGLVALSGAAVASIRRGDADERLVLTTLVLIAVGLIAPISVGILWPAGPRIFPFAYLTGLALVHPRVRGVRVFAAIVGAVVLLDAALIGYRSLEIDRDYARFLSGTEMVSRGSRILPIIDTTFDRAGPILPFWSVGSLYTTLRGGSHPYVFARPHWKTGGDAIRYLDYGAYTHAFLYEDGVTPDRYRGAAGSYDFVLVWGGDRGLDDVLGSEFRGVFEEGPLRIYGPAEEKR
jgi:hypothetical protein